MTRAFVIDTCVARSCAGAGSASAHAQACRAALQAVRAGEHCMVLTPALRDEYGRQAYMSKFFVKYLAEMRARRRVWLLNADPPPYQDVRAAMRTRVPKEAHPLVKKDLHLVGAAMATDERILSDDDKVRAHLSTMAAAVATLARVHWVNPSHSGCPAWLAGGAHDEPSLQLGAVAPTTPG